MRKYEWFTQKVDSRWGGTMIGFADARSRAEAYIATLRIDDVLIIEDAVTETADAWYFPYNGAAFLLHGDSSAALAGNVPIKVPKNGGEACFENPVPPEGVLSDRWCDQFQCVVERLGQSARVQRKYLQHWRVGVDELALEFGDLLLPHRLSLTDDQEEAAREIDRRLREMTDAPDIGQWSSIGLSDPRWVEIRRVARALLMSLRSGRPISDCR